VSLSLTKPGGPGIPALLLTLAAATAMGALFRVVGIPLPWMLGAMAATGILAWHDRAAVAPPTRPAGLILLGLGFGQTFSPQVIGAVGLAVPWLIVGAFLSILAGVAAAKVFAKLAGTDDQTGYYAAVPGGVIVMAILAQRANVSVPAVTLAQSIRVMVVVIVVPPLVTWLAPHGDGGVFFVEPPPVHLPGLLLLLVLGLGAALALSRTSLANPWMFGPCLMVIALAATGLLPSGVPSWMVNAGQVGMGMSLGARMNKRFLLSSRRLAQASVVTTLLLCGLMALLALPLAAVSGLPAVAAILGMSPGGMPEMTVTAKTLEAGVPLVLAFHMIRTLICNLTVQPLWNLWVKLGLAK
jgi:membrane AbrB-like protein